MRTVYSSLILSLALTVLSAGQQMATPGPTSSETSMVAKPYVASAAAAQQPSLPRPIRSTYLLGPDDQISIQALDAEELSSKPVRIDMNGFIRLPLIGRVQAGGLTVEQLEAEITERLRTYVKQPDVTVALLEFRSQPISVLGSVKSPGVYQLQGHKTLVECLSLAGGTTDDAGYMVKITRRLEWGTIPLATAVTDPTGHFSVAQVSLEGIVAGRSPAENVSILPEDIISVPRADMVYVIGTVPRPGGYILHDRATLSVLQALSLAGGIDRGAAPQKARILRSVAGSESRQEMAVNLKAVMAGQSKDIPLLADDILFVPSSAAKSGFTHAAEAALAIGTGLAIVH